MFGSSRSSVHSRLIFLLAFLASVHALAIAGCDSCKKDPSQGTPQSAGPRTNGLTEAEAKQVLAKVGDRTITLGEFANELARQGAYLRARYGSVERRREFLDTMIRAELLAQEARRRGLDKAPEVVEARRKALVQEVLKREFDTRLQLAHVPDAEVKAYYDSHQAEFHRPEQVRISHILLRDRAAAQRVLTLARQNPSDDGAFRQLVNDHTQDEATRDRFGDLGFGSRPTERLPDEPPLADAVVEAAFALTDIGGIAPQLVQTPAGFHIVRLTARRAAQHQSLEDVSRSIRSQLWRHRRDQALAQYVDQLRAAANVQENFAALENIRLPATVDPGRTTVPPGTTPPGTLPLPDLEPPTP